jgi:hypothetical protein
LHGIDSNVEASDRAFNAWFDLAQSVQGIQKSLFTPVKAMNAMTLMIEARETLFIVLVGVFVVLMVFENDAVLLIFAVCVEKTRQINCFVLQCCT